MGGVEDWRSGGVEECIFDVLLSQAMYSSVLT